MKLGRTTTVLSTMALIIVVIAGALGVISLKSHPSNPPTTSSASLTTASVATTLPIINTSYSPTAQSQATSTGSSSSCSRYPPDGNCPGTYNYTFTASVNYTGPWKLTYLGYNNLGKTNPTNVSGNYTGSGYFAKNVTMTSVDTGGLTLCANAQKLDGSNSTLILTVTGHNQTSLPYGSTSYCGGVVP